MFLNNLIKSKVSSLLRPWLNEEPELELKLGFLSSEGKIDNLHFNVSALNELLDNDGICLRFKEVTIDRFSVEFTNWFKPWCTLHVHGLKMLLVVGEEEDEIEEGTGRKRPKVRDTTEDVLVSALAEIDPEGSALHDIIKRISNFSGGSWRNSLYSRIFGRCSLLISGLDVLVQSPSSDDPPLLILGVKEFIMRPQLSLRVPSGKVFFDLDIKGIEIGLRSKSHLSSILPPTDFHTCITFYNFQLTDIVISVPSLCFAFSPTDLSVILLFCLLSSRKPHYTRNGLQLWRIAASKMSYLISDPRLSLNRVVGDVYQWIVYLRSYQNVLSSMGYPQDDRIKRYATMVIRERTFSDSLKYQLRVISEIEKKLPVHAIVQARRIARQEATLRTQELKNIDQHARPNKLIWKFFRILALAWDFLCSLFFSLSSIMLLQSHPKNFDHLEGIKEDSLPRLCFILEVGEVSVSTSQSYGDFASPRGNLDSKAGVSYQNLVSFNFSVDALFARYSQNILEKCLSFAFGSSKMLSAPAVNDSSNSRKYMSEKQKNKSNNMKSVLWTEPAQFIFFGENVQVNAASTGEASITYLESLVGTLWSNWKNFHQNVCENIRGSLEHPFIVCESKFLLTNQSPKGHSCGFWNCGLVVGKLNIFLEYSSIISMAVLIGEIQNALSWASNQSHVSLSGTLIDDLLPVGWSGMFKSYMRRAQMGIVGLFPEKHIQIGALIAGPLIQVSVREEHFDAIDADLCHVIQKDNMLFSIEVDGIDLLVLPDINALFASPIRQNETIDTQLKDCQLKVDKEVSGRNDISKGEILVGGYLKFDGLKAYIGEPSDVSAYQLLTLGPTTIALSSLRKNAHSFGTADIVFFAASSLMASGVAATLFLYELFILTKVVSGLFYAFRHAFDSVGIMGGQEALRQLMKYVEICSTRVELTSDTNTNILCAVSTSFVLNSVQIVLPDSYRSFEPETHATGMIGASSLKLSSQDVPNCGVNFVIEQLALEVSLEEEKAEIFFKLTQLHVLLFKCSPEVLDIDQTKFENLVSASSCLCDASLSHFKFSLCVAILEEAEQDGSFPSFIGISTSNGLINLPVNSTLETLSDRPSISERPRTQSTSWLLAHLTLSDVYVVGRPMKNILSRKHDSLELEITFSIAGQLQTVTCQSQGGAIFLETSALMLLVQIFDSYFHWIKYLLSAPVSSEERANQHGDDMASTNTNPSPHTLDFHKVNWNLLETFTMDISQLCLALLASDGTGRIDELLLEMDTHLDLRLGNMTRQSSLVISKLSILSLSLYNKMEDQNLEIQSPHVSSNISIETLTNNDPSGSVDHDDMMLQNESSSRHSILNNGYSLHDLVDSDDQIFCSHPQNYILKELSISLMVELPMKRDIMESLCLNETWGGNGSISGLELTISLRELQMILFALESMTDLFGKGRADDLTRWTLTSTQDSEELMGKTIADGTIIAIQDVYQHMYIVVEDAESRYRLGGALHYSLAGQRALFKVKYHKMRWKTHQQYFSLHSLYAKNDSGEPLRLNCRSRSDFLDISGSDDSAWSLWKLSPFENEAYEGDTEWDSYHPLGKNTFSLVNKKNESCVGFIDGLWELTGKPGNPVKMKVLDNLSPSRCISANDHDSVVASDSTVECEAQLPEEQCNKASEVPGFVFTVAKVSLMIIHEHSNSLEKCPLLQGCINSTEVIVQILNTKIRVMSTLELLLSYFDARRNTWRELVNQLVLSIFYRSRFSYPGSKNVVYEVPVHLYSRVDKLDVSVTELSLDILLFVVGELNLAGPYAVESSSILGNCCKVENSLGLGILCQFNNEDNVSVTAQKSLTVFLRQLATRNQHPEFSVRVMGHPPLSTSLIHLPLVQAEPIAWKTCILSSQGSKSFPGPFIVVEVSRSLEDGLSVIVSPMLKIHNETNFSMELRFQRPEKKETDLASLNLNAGDSIDDTMVAFSAINLSGGSKRALVSLGIGNFLFSFRPKYTDIKDKNISSVEWSEDLKGGKPVRLSGVFDKLSYQVRKAFSAEAVKSSLSTVNCALKLENKEVGNVYFLIQTITREVPIVHTDKSGLAPSSSPVALQKLKEIFLLPTVNVANMLHTEIHVNLTDKDPHVSQGDDNIGSKATIPSGSSVNLYANPSTLYLVITLTSFGSSCKTVNSSDWVRKLEKQKSNVRHLDIELDFGNGEYFASLRLSRGDRGMLQVAVFTSYTLVNDMYFSLQCFPASQKQLSRDKVERQGIEADGESPFYLPQNSTSSWLMKSPKVRLKLSEDRAHEAQLDLDAISGLTEIDLLVEEKPGLNIMMRLGVSVRAPTSKLVLSQIIVIKPRYVISNESQQMINFKQCYLEQGDMAGIIAVNSKHKAILRLQTEIKNKRESTILENLLKKHKKAEDDSLLIHFRPEEAGLAWSGPISVASLGRFFLRFKSSVQSSVSGSVNGTMNRSKSCEFAAVHVVEEGSTIVLHFHRPPNIDVPYRIENCLRSSPITFYQKGSDEPEILGSGATIDYVWDDLTLPHKLVVQIDDVHLLREIHLDKLRGWKPLYRSNQTTALGLQLSLPKTSENQRSNFLRSASPKPVQLGYEVYADGLTRVLRISEFSDRRNVDSVIRSSSKMRLKISHLTVQLLERVKQEMDMEEQSDCAPVIMTRVQNINIISTFTGLKKFNKITVESMNVDMKWNGAPFASMLRKHQSEINDTNVNILHVAIILLRPSASSTVKQVKCLSIVLQPLDLNLDEETLMKMIPFWRTSLSDAPSQQYYFDHFEIHPIKIVASFLPGDSYYSYNSTQETVRSLLHSVIKIPAIKRKVVELNGVLITHALITMGELSVRCAQHYSWYTLRAIYIAKGSPLLPPAFASMFDDLASSSLDVFFDPSSGVINLPGLSIGTFKLIKKYIDGNGLSGTKRYFGDLGKTLKSAGSNVLFAVVTEISDSILRGAKANGWKGMVNGFHQGILQLAMEPSVLGSAVMEGGPDRKIKLDRTPGVDELYIEGYLQAMLDAIYKQEYLRVRVMDNQVILKNLPPNSSLVDEIMERVKGFLVAKALLKGDPSIAAHSLRHIRGENEWRLGPIVLTLCEHLFVSFVIRFLRKQSGQVIANVKLKMFDTDNKDAIVPATDAKDQKARFVWKWGIGKFILSAIVAYIDGRLCRSIPNPLARRIVSGFLLSFLDNDDNG